ncbi:hypothetical protein ACRE_070170 [Hapsidospora chrysogenum ATCC 11550]|uniref:Uncharacterized protein n=1 Tax=Hapsidospora chrysogenum (strain ATCC 11550 / CBS 779.69 / DSM 880 / IAM 14645 / JCM 23072 / IMI 49137) TaxID=857340 RepID=A0A086SYT3_HAPC1|nr:hypothetical protein ACRE_070170 [Hapsidospora chrysogenum ATCC 11550]
MGVDTRKAPPLPAPTETETEQTTPTELTADISKPGDEKSSYSIPDDGTPVTIRTRGHKANRSQTSLLIEYFEGGRSSTNDSGSGSGRKPSVRVRLTPSRKGKGDHLQVTESSRKASLTRRIPLDQGPATRQIEFPDGGSEDANSMTSYASATEESNVSSRPIDIEIDRGYRRRRPASPLIPSNESYQPVNASEISAIPADSFLDGSGPGTELRRSSSPSRGAALATAAGAGALAGVAADRISNNKRRDRAKVAEKPKEKSDRKRRSKSRTSSVSEQPADDYRSSRHRSSRSQQESAVSGADSSVLSSNLTPSHRSEAHSVRSGTSKASSINNPKLLETVEDAIRRLILPELSALKREQSKRETRRGSLTSTGTSVSREDVTTPDRRRSSGQRSEGRRRNREARHEYGDESPRSISRSSVHDEYQADEADPTTPKRVAGGLLGAAAAGAALSKGISALDDKTQSEDRRQRDRRRRRTEAGRSRSQGAERYVEEYDDDQPAPAPPMPLMSDINPSDITRTSILSADTDRTHSASEEMIHEVSQDPPGNLQTLGTSHANVSHGDLTALPRGNKPEYEKEYETDEFGRKVPLGYQDNYIDDQDREYSDPGDYHERSFEDEYYSTQDVPPPLKYVPYQAGARGLSPIPSVSGYTEGGSEAPQPRHSQGTMDDTYPSPEKSLERGGYGGSSQSLNSIPSNMRSREFDQMSAEGRSARSSGVEYRNTMYTDDSELSQVPSAQAVRGVGANPNIVHPPFGVESAVASLVDGSMLEQSVLTGGSGRDYTGQRDSTLSYEENAYSSRGVSPDKQSAEVQRESYEERHPTPGDSSQDRSRDLSEYELDEHGRKIPRSRYRQSPTASEAAITAGAVGAAAAALKAAQGKKQTTVEDVSDNWVPAGVARNKSFKERTLEGYEPRNTPAHSIDRFSYDEPKMGATGVPDMDDPLPEIGYVDEDAKTNPSVVQDRLDGDHGDDQWSGRATPTQQSLTDYGQVVTSNKESASSRGDLGVTEAAGAAALGAAVGMAATHSRDPSQDQDDWQRTSDERKRDTLLTNPYEDASPVVNPELHDNLLGTRGLNTTYDAPYSTGSPGFGQKYDEGYISNGPNPRSPDVQPNGKALNFSEPAQVLGGEDPFYVPKAAPGTRQLSGMSQGMGSPFYDAATGAGIDRIENKDIVALMQHLMVRDAQRSARDTEIVALLMNAALEMRTSFREMKELIQDTGDDVIFSNAENTEKLQKAINGPRPFPGTASRSIQSSQPPTTIDDAATRKKNLWKRALAGLSAKGTSDLSRIEDMLVQLLGEVDVLKTQTAAPGSSTHGRSFENLQPEGQYEQDRGYEPEGVSTASHASQSGHLSIPQARSQGTRTANERKFSDNRVSTVEEHEDEYQYDHPSPVGEASEHVMSGAGHYDPNMRGGSFPPDSPSQHASPSQQHALSADNTPRTDKGKKHKSSSSSGWIPKISRWSETTASSVGRAFRGSGNLKKEQKYGDQPAASRSGSSLGSYDHGYDHDAYGDDKLHSGFSDPNLGTTIDVADPQMGEQAVHVTPEDPKYRAHRNSLNLQHPQPRPGQTERFRTALETSAQEYNDPATPKSADWAGSATSLHRLPPQNTNRYSNASSTAARDAEYWPTSPGAQSGPPRPPKEPIDGYTGRTPPRARISRLAKGSPLQNQVYEGDYVPVGPGSPGSGSPKPENRNLNAALGIPGRRPSGPRAMTPKSPEEDAAREERRRKRDTFGTVTSQDTDTF